MSLQVVTLVLVLESKIAMSHALDNLVRNGDFATPRGRHIRLQGLLSLLRAGEDLRSFVQVDVQGVSMAEAASRAEKMARTQLARIDLKPETVNIASHGHQVERHNAPSVLSQESAASDICLIGVTVSVGEGLATRLTSSDSPDAARKALHLLAAAAPEEIDALYIYFTPAPGEPLTSTDAIAMLNPLRLLAQNL